MFNRSKAFGVLAFVISLGIHAQAQSTPLPVTLSPLTLAFGNQGLNGISTIKSLKVTNSQSLALNIASVNISGDFAIASSACGTTLAPKASCLMTLSFTPTLLGLRSGTLTLTNDASNSPQTVALTGTGAAPAVAAPSALTFGNQAVGSASTSKTLTLTNNNQTSSLNISNIVTAGDFVLLSNGCGAALAPRANCALTLAFNPTALGIASGTLTVTDDAGNSPQIVAVSGTGVVPVGVSPVLVNFGNEALSGTSTGKIVTVINHSQTASLNIANTAITGDFSIASNGCGTILAAKAGCAITIAFTPGTLGSRSGTLTLTDDAGTGPQGVALIGIGVIPVALSPATLGFGNQALGSTSAAKVLKVTNNNQTVGVDISGVNMVGNFALASNGCGTMLAPKTSCTMTLTFSPSALGAQPGSVSLTDDAGNSPQVAALTGAGVVAVAATPAAVSFGNQAMGSNSTAKKITVINNQNVALNISDASVTGDFAIASNDCSAVVAPKASCTVMMTFAPTVLGGRTGLLTLTDDANNAPQTVAFSGSGVVATLVSPATLSFGNQLITTAGAAKTVTLTNNQDVTLNISSIVVTGDYLIQSNSCGASLAAKTKCSITVVFQPAGLAARIGKLTINDDAGNSGRPIALSGNGVTTGLASIAISPAASSIAMGASQQFIVGGTTASGSSLDLTSVATWSSLSPTVVTISPTGLAVSLTTGVSTIKAVLGTFSSSSSLTITSPVLLTLTVTPINPSVTVGQATQFVALGTFSDGNTRDLTTTATWASSDASVAGVSNNPGFQGLATAVSAGAATIAATSGSAAANVLLTVVVPPLLVPSINNISPASGPIGTFVGLTGTKLGSSQADSTVTFSGISVTPAAWSDTSIIVAVPAGLAMGPNPVIVTVGGAAVAGIRPAFTVTPSPLIISLLPTSGPIGTEVTVTGTDFGSNPYVGNRITFGGISAAATNWTDTSITVLVPEGVTAGPNTVVVSGPQGQSPADVTFTALVQPQVTALSPQAGPDGTYVTITGTGFGTVAGNSTVRFGGIAAMPTSWSNNTIVVLVPTGLAPGVNPVVVSNPGFGDSNGEVSFIAQENPALSSLSSRSGSAGDVITISGSHFGGTQGTSTVTFHHTLAAIDSWSDNHIVAHVPPGSDSGPVLVAVNGTNSNGGKFWVRNGTTSDSTVTVSPNKMALLVGQTHSLTAVDAMGTPLSNVDWQISDAAIGSILTGDPTIFTAAAAGQATVTASYQGLTAQGIVNVYAGDTLPIGTELWSLAPDAGANSAYWPILKTIPTPSGTVAFIAITDNDAALGLRADGSLAWTGKVPYADRAIPDSTGGLLDGELNKINGETGEQDWSAPDLMGFLTDIFLNDQRDHIAIHPDGTIFATVQTDRFGHGGVDVIGIDPIHGNVKFRVPIEESSYTLRLYCIDQVESREVASRPTVGPISVGTDGNAYVVYVNGYGSSETFQGCRGGISSGLTVVKLMKIDSSGRASSTLIQHYANSAVNLGGGGSSHDEGWAIPGRSIPDGFGGRLVSFKHVFSEYSQEGRIARVDGEGNVQSEFSLPTNDTMVVGEDGTGFATDGGTVTAFDMNTKQVKWSWTSPLGNPSLTIVAATAGNGLVVRLANVVDLTGQQIVRIDPSGNASYDSWTTSGTYAPIVYAAGQWLARNTATGILGAYASLGFDFAASPYAKPGGTGNNAADQYFWAKAALRRVRDTDLMAKPKCKSFLTTLASRATNNGIPNITADLLALRIRRAADEEQDYVFEGTRSQLMLDEVKFPGAASDKEKIYSIGDWFHAHTGAEALSQANGKAIFLDIDIWNAWYSPRYVTANRLTYYAMGTVMHETLHKLSMVGPLNVVPSNNDSGVHNPMGFIHPNMDDALDDAKALGGGTTSPNRESDQIGTSCFVKP